jgi:hypothetical protein
MDPAELFVPMPECADDVWERLNAFVTAWWRAPGRKESVPSVELDEAERRLGIKLPIPVRNAYAFFGRYPEVTEGMIKWRQPADLRFDDDVLVLCEDDDDMGLWGIRRADLAVEDPPVVACFPALHGERRWATVTDRFSVYFIEHTLLQAVEESSPYRNWAASGDAFVPSPEVRRIATSGAIRPVEEALYGGDDMLVLARDVPPNVVVYIAARTVEAYERANALLPGAAWRNAPDEVHIPRYADYLESVKTTRALLRMLAKKGLLKPKKTGEESG